MEGRTVLSRGPWLGRERGQGKAEKTRRACPRVPQSGGRILKKSPQDLRPRPYPSRKRTLARAPAEPRSRRPPDWLRRRQEAVLRVRASAARARVVCSSLVSVVPAAGPTPGLGQSCPELGMFPELNSLLNTTPDRAEQVRSRAAGRGGSRSVAEDRIPGWSARGFLGKTRRRRVPRHLGVVVRGGPRGDLGSALALTEDRRVSKCPGSLAASALAYVPKPVLGGPVRAHWLPVPSGGGCLIVGSLILPVSQETSFSFALSFSLALRHCASRSERCSSSSSWS